MAQILDFNEARRKKNKPAIDELRALYNDVVTLDMDAAFRYHCDLPDGSREEAEKLDTLLHAFRTNPILANLDKALEG